MPPAEKLTFVDNCAPDTEVESSDREGGGSVCDGKTTIRTWLGPTDDCGNAAALVTQVITVLDAEAPVLPESMEPIHYTCPETFDKANLIFPEATDDCSTSVSVNLEATEKSGCNNITLTWIATDACDKKSNATQSVRLFATISVVPPRIITSPSLFLLFSCLAYRCTLLTQSPQNFPARPLPNLL